jgi:hypothetical protein
MLSDDLARVRDVALDKAIIGGRGLRLDDGRGHDTNGKQNCGHAGQTARNCAETPLRGPEQPRHEDLPFATGSDQRNSYMEALLGLLAGAITRSDALTAFLYGNFGYSL